MGFSYIWYLQFIVRVVHVRLLGFSTDFDVGCLITIIAVRNRA